MSKMIWAINIGIVCLYDLPIGSGDHPLLYYMIAIPMAIIEGVAYGL
jgi:hypothetical protein